MMNVPARVSHQLPARWTQTTRLLAVLALLASTVARTSAQDWPNWRGPDQNRSSQETGLVDQWNPKGGPDSNLLWKNAELAGRSTPVVLGEHLYTLVRDQPGTELEGEKVVCANAATGEVLWQHRFNVYLSDVPDTRVGWSSVAADPATGRVYALGVCGYLVCLEGESGRVVWERSLHEELGLLSTYGGRTNSPVIHEDTVILSAVVIGWGDSPKWGLLAKPAHRFLGFDNATGELRWLSSTRLIPYDTTYSTPALATLAGQRALVFGSGDGAAWAMQAGTGKTLWKCQLSRRGVNISPAVDPKGRVYIGHSEENIVGNAMGAFASIDGTDVGKQEPKDLTGSERWINYQQMVGKSSPLFYNDRVYAVTDSAKLFILDAATGKQVARKTLGRVMRGTPLLADGKLYAATRGGRVHILRPTAEGVDSLHTVALRNEQIDASPIAAHGRVYLATSKQLYCLGKEDAPVPSPFTPAEPARRKISDRRVAQVQLIPWDMLLAPGEEQQYQVRLYNESGDFLRNAKPENVTFGVAGPGEITHSGQYRSPSKAGHTTALVLAEVEGISAQARLRIVPPLPWSFNFEGSQGKGAKVPLTWVGGRVRYVSRKGSDGNHYLAKPTELPTRPGAPTTKLGTRSRMWMGPHTLCNYTVRADIQLREGRAGEVIGTAEGPPVSANAMVKLPTAGLINSRYTFALFGPSQEARLYSWCTHDKRTQASAKMDLKPGVWYRMLLKVVPNKKKGIARVRAKVWRRGDEEPDGWTLAFDDSAPNLQGSPGLFGDAKEAEFYVDNLRVTPN